MSVSLSELRLHFKMSEEIGVESVQYLHGDERIEQDSIIFEDWAAQSVQSEDSCPEFIIEENEGITQECGSTVWLEGATKLLISLIGEFLPKVGKSAKVKSKGQMWNIIQTKMVEYGYSFTRKQIENKFGSLLRAFKKAKCYNRKTGRDRMVCPFERELSELFGDRPAISPRFFVGRQKENVKRSSVCEDSLELDRRSEILESASEDNGNESFTLSGSSSNTAKKNTISRELLEETKQMRKEQKEIGEKIFKILDESTKTKNELMERRNNILSETMEERNHILLERNNILRSLLENNK